MTLCKICLVLAIQCLLVLPVYAKTQMEPVVILVDKWIGTVNPHKVILTEEYMIARQVFETLIKVDENGDFLPLLAEKWRFGEDGKIITITLRKDIQFSNGAFLKAELIHEMIKNASSSQIVHGLDKIKGVLEFKKKLSTEISGFKKLSPAMFSIEFVEPAFDILRDFSDIHCSIASKTNGGIYGTGPYTVTRIADKRIVYLRKNKFYSRGDVNIDKYLITTNETTHDPDLSMKANRVFHPRLNSAYNYFTPAIYFLGFNANHIDYQDIKTRASLAALLDMDLANSVYGAQPYKLSGFLPLGLFGHNPKLTTTSEYSNNSGSNDVPKNIVLYYHRKKPKRLAEAFCEKVIKYANTNCRSKEINLTQLMQGTKNGKIGVFLMMFKPSVPITSDLLTIFLLDSELNLFTYQSKAKTALKLDSLVRESLKPDYSDRNLNLYHEIDHMIINNFYAKPFLYGTEETVYHSKHIKLPYIGLLGLSEMPLSKVQYTKTDD